MSNEFYSIPERSKDFAISTYYSPELFNGQPVSAKTDIYSLGKLISIFKFENNSIVFDNELKKLHEIELKCTKTNEEERPNIFEVIDDFYINIYSKIFKLEESDDISAISNYHGKLFSFYWYLIAEYQKIESQLLLGFLYLDVFYIWEDKEKIYYCEKTKFDPNIKYDVVHFIPQNINKSIFYLELAAKKNNAIAEFYLVMIYLSGNSSSCEECRENLSKAIKDYTFIIIFENIELDQNEIIKQNMISSNIIIINHFKESNSKSDDFYFIIGFKKILLLLNLSI